MANIPAIRVRECNAAPIRADGDYVLHWMTAFRRTTWNYSLQRSVEWARLLKKPLVIFEALRIGYQWASDRLHRFILEGMAENARHLESSRRHGILYYPYVEPVAGAGRGLLAALARRACVAVADEYPCFFLPRMVAVAARKLPVRLEQVDSNGIMPLRAAERVFTTASAFRRFLQKTLRPHLDDFPKSRPLTGVKLPPLPSLPADILRRWPPAADALLAAHPHELAQLPLDHSVAPVVYRGGTSAARAVLRRFLDRKLDCYAEEANHPDADVRSTLSPYLHFGHISAHEVFQETVQREGWSAARLAERANGKREGWWNMSAPAEAFIDELLTWRELGYNMTFLREDYDRYESLPNWAKTTLEKHAADPRAHLYTLAQFEAAETHDPLWNAAQRQLVHEGRIHNYLRMLWGKKILEWTTGPREALDVMIELNNKYAVDGRDPNSYSGIFWVLGRYDRPWGPERPIFGTVRYMSSRSTLRKLRVRQYLESYGNAAS